MCINVKYAKPPSYYPTTTRASLLSAFYRAIAPTRVKRATTPEMARGAMSRAGTEPRMAALLDEVDEPAPVPVVESPPSVKVGSSVPASCEPAPLRPGPLPAPFSKYCHHMVSRCAISG